MVLAMIIERADGIENVRKSCRVTHISTVEGVVVGTYRMSHVVIVCPGYFGAFCNRDTGCGECHPGDIYGIAVSVATGVVVVAIRTAAFVARPR
jgi:hypothetical protein